jgi:RHS repeat-associated protein
VVSVDSAVERAGRSRAVRCFIFAFVGLWLVVVPSVARAATHVPTSTLTGATEWSAGGSPYVLDGNVTVPAGATLTVDPGVTVKLNGATRVLTVSGTLRAFGSTSSPIVFTSYQDDSVAGDTNGDGNASSGAPGQWTAITFLSGSTGTLLNTDVRFGGYTSSSSTCVLAGVGEVQAPNSGAATVTVQDSTLEQSFCEGLFVYAGVANVIDSLITNNRWGVQVMNSGQVNIGERTAIVNNTQYGFYANVSSTAAGRSSILDTDISGNGSYGMYLNAGSLPVLALGHRNNIYGNNGGGIQVYINGTASQTRSATDWTGNFWGSDAFFNFNNPSCLTTSPAIAGYMKNTLGTLFYAPASYSAGTFPHIVTCWYDRIAVGQNDFSPVYIGSPSVSVLTGQTFGPSAWDSVPGIEQVAVNPTGVFGEPVNGATGNFYTAAVDLSLPAIGIPFTFIRSYNSADTAIGRFGGGWSDALDWSLSFDSDGNATLHSGSGQRLHFSNQGSGAFLADAGGRATLAANGAGYKLVSQAQTIYLFTSAGTLSSVSDRNGQGLTLSYDSSGNLQRVTLSDGRTVIFTTTGGLVTGATLPDGRSVAYSYTGSRLSSFTDLRGHTVAYTYDGSGRLATVTDQNGHTVISNSYDAATGRVTGQTDGRGHASSFGWTSATGTATYTDANGHTWTQVYANNVLRSAQDPLGHTVAYHYATDLNLTSITDQRGNTTAFSWDNNGNLLSETGPASLAYVESWTHDARNNVTSYRDGRGNTTSYGYDTNGNLTSITGADPDGSGPLTAPVTNYGRDASTGLITSVTNPHGKQTTFGHNSAGEVISVTSPLGNQTTYGYDAGGRLTSTVEPRGNLPGATASDYTELYDYDAAGHLTSTTDPLGHTTARSYDATGNLTSSTDENNHTTSYVYDNANELTQRTAPDTSHSDYSYDNNGNRLTQSDANGHSTSYSYDNANRLIAVEKPGGEIWSYSYDAAGNLASTVDANGNAAHTGATATYGYDALQRLTSITYSSSTTPNVSYSYDADGNRTQMADGAGTVTYNYDNLNRPTGVSRGSSTFSYSYDAGSNLVAESYPNGATVAYSYTDDGRLATAASNAQTTTYSYDADGNLATTTLPAANGFRETRIYDRAGTLTDISNTNAAGTLSEFAYTRDAAGNPTKIARTGSTTATHTYVYDELDRLTADCAQTSCPNSGDPKTTWTYDNVGNRLTQTTPAASTTYTYNTDDELTAAGPTSYSYDANGNQTQAGSNTYSYDLENRLAAATVGSTTAYSYDGDGNRLTAAASTTTKYTWDPAATIPQLDSEQDSAGNTIRSYLYGNNLISTTTGGTTPATYYYHHDGQDSVSDVTDASGAPEWTYAYDAWGNTIATANTSSPPANPIQYTGAYTDPTGLDHMGARDYDPGTGRFTATDPENAATGSTYAYVDNRPTAFTDPTGLCKTCPPSISEIGGWIKDGAGAVSSYKNCIAFAAIIVGAEFVDPLGGGIIAEEALSAEFAAEAETSLVRYDADFALSQLTRGGSAKASELVDFAESQSWTRAQTATGPIKYLDDNGVPRLTIKSGSPRAPGSNFPRVEMRNAAGQRVDPYGNAVPRRSPGNHTPIELDLP